MNRNRSIREIDTLKTEEYIRKYLKENIIESETLHRMRHVIQEFAIRAPKILVTKCIDGRVHGSKAKGYPPTTIRFGRTDGNIVKTDKSNYWFWNRIDNIINSAICNTPEMPAVFIAYMHRSDRGFGCAAHHNDENASYDAIQSQTREVEKIYPKNDLYVLQGIINTDIMAETLIFEESIRLDTSEILSDFDLKELKDIFHKSFLKYPIRDPATHRYIHSKIPEEIISGEIPLLHGDFQTSLTMKSFLLRECFRLIQEEDTNSQKLVQPDLFNAIITKLESVKSLPKALIPVFFYQVFWNISYALNQKSKLEKLNNEEQLKIIGHSEEIICYGDGFELLPRNKTILVKTGRGDDYEALQVAKSVLQKNRSSKKSDYSEIVHINIEVSGEQINWEDFNDNISSKVRTMFRPISEIFGNDVSVLTTYSYRDQKRFYPIKSIEDDRISFPIDILEGINRSLHFSNLALRSHEAIYPTKI